MNVNPSDPHGEPAWLVGIARLSSALNRIAAAVAAVLLVLMTCQILLEICLRVVSKSTYMADSLVAHGVAAVTFLAMGWTIESGGMIRVGLLQQRAGPRLLWLLECFATVSTFSILVFLARFVWKSAARNWITGRVTQTMLPIPLWIPDAIFLVGLFLLCLHLFVRFLRLFTRGARVEAEVVI